MKKLIAVSFVVVLCHTLCGQVMKYQRVLIKRVEGFEKRLLELGITIDHSHATKQGIETEISLAEVAVLKQNQIAFEVAIDDMASYYAERNHSQSQLKTTATGVCNEPEIAVPTHFHLGSMGGYFTLQEMVNIIDSMALLYPNLVKVKQPISTTQSFEGRNIWYVKFSDNPNQDENEPEVLYTALHHAREAASLSQLIFYMWYMLENYATDPDIKATLDNTELFFVPCVNPDGYVYNQTTNPNGGGMWRKNRRLNADNTYGVDLNRNYGENWGYDNLGSSPSTTSDVYRGTAAFSEPETQAMQSFCNARQFANALNAHTFSNVFIYPWGHLQSFYTPDNTTYDKWGAFLTKESRFAYGTCDQVLNYVTNGSSDDWMYGEQTSKGKIFAMTPESGTYNDGFWPVSTRIIDICKTTFRQNYNLAKLAGNYAVLNDDEDKFISGNGYINYKLTRLGLGAGSFTVSITPYGNGLATTGAPKTYAAMSQNQVISDSIPFALIGGLLPAQEIRYLLCITNGNVTTCDTITKIYGTPVTVFYDNASAGISNFSSVASWGITTADFVSPPNCFTDSPLTMYAPDDHKNLTTKNEYDLKDALYAHLQYYTKFEIEKTFDKVEIQVSTNNGVNYSPLCGKYETSPVSFGGTTPVYDGKQNTWVLEDIDLSQYTGSKIKLRFTLDVDFYNEKDGFYVDDILVRKIVPATNPGNVGLSKMVLMDHDLSFGPNPSDGKFNVFNPNTRELEVLVYTNLGQLVYSSPKSNSVTVQINLGNNPAGVYFMQCKTTDGIFIKTLIVTK